MPDYITRGGYHKLVQEFEWLLKEERPRITREVAYAASLGDRSENASYIYGKKRLREIDRRLRFLRNRIESVEVVTPEDVASDRIRFGARVVVEDGQGEQHTYTLVGVDEANVKAGRVNYSSPLGRALIGKEEGDEAVIQAPGGKRTLEILEFDYEPDDE